MTDRCNYFSQACKLLFIAVSLINADELYLYNKSPTVKDTAYFLKFTSMTEISVTNEISCDPLFSERLLAIDQ
ncbi:hypothetical protein T12_7511 [Trichinella patagoniensis]|uniref:PiggyBac transposable element-derived protein domain-containing protein n=1 Tax=Trichinella patagoniensis TaxID=990121 RepID=A0A0V0YUQ5_9BILA|nr:hypothetical protein T12_7511 [Trichinella patagoniensis]